MERYLRGCRGARRTRVRVVREPDEFLSLEDERRFHEEEGNDSNNENSASEVSETDGIPDSAFISGIAVERLKLPVIVESAVTEALKLEVKKRYQAFLSKFLPYRKKGFP